MADEASTPAQRRREATAAKLQGAFERMLESPAHRLTVAALAREAGIGRNAIYANHRDYLEALASLQAARLAVAPQSRLSIIGATRRRRSRVSLRSGANSPAKMLVCSSGPWTPRHGPSG